MSNYQNIKGQKPDAFQITDTLEKAFSSSVIRKNKNLKILLESVKDILSQYKNNNYKEIDERNIKIVDLILERNKILLEGILREEISLDNIKSILDLNVEGCLNDFLIINPNLKQLKNDIIEIISSAIFKYSKNTTITTNNYYEEKNIETKLIIEKHKIIDNNQNIDNYDVIKKYLNNVQGYMKSLYKKALKNKSNINIINKTLLPKTTTLKPTNNLIKNINQNKNIKNINKNLIKNVNQSKETKTISRNLIKNFNQNKEINNFYLKNIKKVLSSISNFTEKITIKAFSNSKKLISRLVSKSKDIVGTIITSIVSFAFSFVPYIGPFLKLLLPVLRIGIFLLRVGFKILNFSIKLVLNTAKFLFKGLIASLKFIISGAFKLIGGTINLIKKVISSNTVKAIIKFLFTTPTGMYILGYISGILYKKVIYPIYTKFESLKQIYFDEKDELERKLKNKIAIIQKRITDSELFNDSKEMINNVYKILTDKNLNVKIKKYFYYDYLKLSEFINEIQEFFKSVIYSTVGRKIGWLAGSVLSTLGSLPPPLGLIGKAITGVVMIGAAIWQFFTKPNEPDKDSDEVATHKLQMYQGLKQQYGYRPSKENEDPNLPDYSNLLLESMKRGVQAFGEKFKRSEDGTSLEYNEEDAYKDAEYRAIEQRKLMAEQMIGLLTPQQKNFVEKFDRNLHNELTFLSNSSFDHFEYSDLNYSKLPKFNKLDDSFNFDKCEVMELKDYKNPIPYRLMRVSILQEMLNRYRNGLISFDNFISLIKNVDNDNKNTCYINQEYYNEFLKRQNLQDKTFKAILNTEEYNLNDYGRNTLNAIKESVLIDQIDYQNEYSTEFLNPDGSYSLKRFNEYANASTTLKKLSESKSEQDQDIVFKLDKFLYWNANNPDFKSLSFDDKVSLLERLVSDLKIDIEEAREKAKEKYDADYSRALEALMEQGYDGNMGGYESADEYLDSLNGTNEQTITSINSTPTAKQITSGSEQSQTELGTQLEQLATDDQKDKISLMQDRNKELEEDVEQLKEAKDAVDKDTGVAVVSNSTLIRTANESETNDAQTEAKKFEEGSNGIDIGV